MRTLSLTKINENSFAIKVSESYISSENELKRRTTYSASSDLESVVSKMDKAGVDKSETLYALNMLKENRHNVAYFGFLGSFTSSENTLEIVGNC